MARRRKSHAKKHHTKRRRKMSGIGSKGGIMSALTIIAGAVAGQALSKVVDKANTFTTSTTTKGYINSAAPIVAGILLPKLIKSELGKNLGTGMIAAGGLKLVTTAMPTLAGVGAMPYNVYANKPAPAIAGYTSSNPSTYIAGIAALQEMENC
jgi:hypothetical protein